MKITESFKKLLADDDFINNTTQFVKTLNGIASLILIALALYLPYQAIREIIAWF